MPDIAITPLSMALVREAAIFFQERLSDTFAHTFPQNALAKYNKDYSEDALQEQVRSGDTVLLTAISENTVLGIMFGSRINGGVASVVWIAVSPERRRQGIGKRLLDKTFELYQKRGAHKLVLYTETEAARNFYEREGMELEGIHPNHWWGITHYCLAKKLIPGHP